MLYDPSKKRKPSANSPKGIELIKGLQERCRELEKRIKVEQAAHTPNTEYINLLKSRVKDINASIELNLERMATFNPALYEKYLKQKKR